MPSHMQQRPNSPCVNFALAPDTTDTQPAFLAGMTLFVSVIVLELTKQHIGASVNYDLRHLFFYIQNIGDPYGNRIQKD